ncbi:hypothetical protein D3C79_499760 [compost metagenome]
MRRRWKTWPAARNGHEPARLDFRLVHRPPGRHPAADLRPAAARGHCLSAPAGGTTAGSRLPDHPGHRPAARRQPGNHGLVSGHAAGSAVQRHPRHDPDDQQQRTGLDQPDPAVHPRQEHRHRRPGSPGGDQHRHRAPAPGHAQPADLAQGQPGRQPGADPHRQLGADAGQRTERLRRNPAGQATEPDRRRRPDQHHRPVAPGHPCSGPAGKTRRPGADPRRSATVDPADQPEPGQRRTVW